MRTLHVIIATAVALVTAAAVHAQKGIDNPMTRAVLDVYQRQLQEDPTDWETWMRRANEYYNHDEYMRALNDIDNALKYIPADKRDDRAAALMLRANIYTLTGRHAEALADLDSALALNPNDYITIYQRANANYELGNYDNAKEDYKRLQRINPRSAEALIGLARVAVLENNLGLANEYLDDAVSLDPNNADYYVRRASVRKQMGNHSNAIEDLILALSTDSRNTRATQDLVDYADTNYADVIAGLTSAMQSAPKVGMFVYLRAVISQAHFRYTAALDDFRRIIDQQLYDYHGIYASMAECQLALGQYQDALASIDHAISMDANSAAHFVLKAQILRALHRDSEAVDVALQSTVINPGLTEPLVELGICRAATGKWEEANELYGEAALSGNTSPMLNLLRAQVLAEHLNQPVAARRFRELTAQAEGYADTDVNSLKGFALLMTGQTTEARTWMNNILSTVPDNDGFVNFMGACFFSMDGDSDSALQCAAKALDAGYANYYDWMDNTSSPVTVKTLRDDLRFLNLIERHNRIFGR